MDTELEEFFNILQAFKGEYNSKTLNGVKMVKQKNGEFDKLNQN